MNQNFSEHARDALETIYRNESRRVLATLIRLVGDFDLAEEGLHDAITAAMEQWPRDGVPANPRAWLVSTGRFKAIDRIRRRARFDTSLEEAVDQLHTQAIDPAQWDDEHLEDDRLRLIFTACHPALPQEAQLALTLREMCGLTTEEIARHSSPGAPRSPSGSYALKRRSGTQVFPMKYRHEPTYPIGWTPSFRSSISSLPRDTPRHRDHC